MERIIMERIIRTRVIGKIVAKALLVLIMSASQASAQQFPNRPITVIVPWAAGGGADITCRLLASKMKEILGQPVVVKNLPGAGSLIGAQALVDSKPDGYTVGFLGISAVIAQYTSATPPHDGSIHTNIGDP